MKIKPNKLMHWSGKTRRALLRNGNVYNGMIKSVEIALYIIILGES